MTYEVISVKKKEPPKRPIRYHSYAAGFKFVLTKDYEHLFQSPTEDRLIRFNKGHEFYTHDYFTNLDGRAGYSLPRILIYDEHANMFSIELYEACDIGLDQIGWMNYSNEVLKDKKRF